MGSSSGNRGARAIAISRHLKVLLPSSTSHKLRISDELARHWDGVGTAPVVSPLGKVWRVQVARDAGGAFLGRGWPEFAAAHGFGAGWFLVFRHEACGGVLTVKAFDTTCCLREFTRPITAANHGGGSHRPQFISVLLPPSMEKMGIPPKFLKNYISGLETGSSISILLSPLCKFCRITVEKDQSSGTLFFSGGWSRFLASHGITEYDVLLLRHEGDMVFTVKVFGPDGCQKRCKDQDTNSKQQEQSERTVFSDTKTEEEDAPSSSRKSNGKEKKPDGEENSKRPTSPTTWSKKAPLSVSKPAYEIGPPSWMKREISTSTLWKRLSIAGAFCKAIGLWRTSEVTLRTTVDEDCGHRSWQVRFLFYENRNSGELTRGWRKFCTDNRIKEGDTCTFNIMKATLWHVDITRHCNNQGTSSKQLEQSDKTTFSEKKDVPSSSRKRMCKDKKPDGEENSKRPKSPTTSLNKAPSSIVYEIGPPSWLKRVISAYILSEQLYVPGNFCKAIGLRRTSEITLRTKANEDHGFRSWQVRFLVYGKCNSGLLTRGWSGFCADNRIKEGDICTFNIMKTTLWHVDIMRNV